MDLQEKVSHFPTGPGVYLMRGAGGEVLYVGKAKSLRARVRSYFRDGGDGRLRIQFLMGKVADIEYLLTGSEKEALILENTLIKRHRPRYNVDLRDDKTYLSLRLDVQNPYPRLTAVRQVRRDGALYFGPYSSARGLRQTVDLIHRIFPLRQCSDRELKNRTRPCLYCQIRGCRAPCCGLIDRSEYRAIVDQVVLFLRGRHGSLLESLQEQMRAAAEHQEFESAALLRDRIRAIEVTLERQQAVSHARRDRDVVGWIREGGEVQIVVLVIRSGNLLDRRAYYLKEVFGTDGEVLVEFLERYYRGDRIVPEQVLVGVEPPAEEVAVLDRWLSDKRGRKVQVARPQRGEKRRLVTLAETNARELLDERRRTKVGYDAALAELQERLGLPSLPRRVECFDISNIQGSRAVGSRVTFLDGFPYPQGYRRFAVRDVAGADDYAMLYEVLSRRLARNDPDWEYPDLLVVDGGRGQLNAALRALRDAGVEGVPVAGLAKARALPGRRAERVEHSPERVFLPDRENPLVLAPNSSALFLLQRLRDEAHRFAITYHRKQRSRAALKSQLESIPGVGTERRKQLLRHFGSLRRLRAATPEALAEVPGISVVLARRIHGALAGDEGGAADG